MGNNLYLRRTNSKLNPLLIYKIMYIKSGFSSETSWQLRKAAPDNSSSLIKWLRMSDVDNPANVQHYTSKSSCRQNNTSQ